MAGRNAPLEPITIDGSAGEGGGQILRLSAALSAVSGAPVRITNVRAGRKNPGLGAQHAAAVRVLARVCGAKTEGARAGSREVLFAPGGGGERDISESVGTAGSVPLILQAALPAAALSGRRARFEIRGGTDVPWSPTADYMSEVFAPALKSFGADVSVEARRRGYYPRGGGLVEARAEPARARAASFGGAPERFRVRCAHSGVRGAGEQCRRASEELEKTGLPVSVRLERSAGGGGSLLACAAGRGCAAGADSLWKGGFGPVAQELLGCLSVDENLADMLVLPASVADGTSSWTVRRITPHLETALETASRISGCRYGVVRKKAGYEIRVRGVRC